MFHRKASFTAHLFLLLLEVFQLNTASAQTVKILQLGESYSSGTGARNSRGRPDYEGRHCSRSPSNWGSQYAAEMAKTYNVTYINRACGNGFFEDIWNPNELEVRPRLLCPHRRFRTQEDMYFERVGLFRCAQYAEPQLNYVDESVDLVFMTMGGNDIGFINIVQSCFMRLALADARACRDTIDEAYELLKITAVQAENALLNIWDKMGRSGKVVYFGYPYIVQNVSRVLRDPLTEIEIDAPQAVREFTDFGNGQLEKALNDANEVAGEEFATFWSKTAEVFEGHEPDPYNFRLNSDRWMYEIRARSLKESFHPNPRGHAEWAAAVVEEGLFGLEEAT